MRQAVLQILTLPSLILPSLISGSYLGMMVLGLPERSLAVPPDPSSPISTGNLIPDPTPLNTNDLKPGKAPASIVTSKTISPTHLTVPSLWWVREQITDRSRFSSKLIEDWLAYPGNQVQPGQMNLPGRVDLIVNRQLWSLLDYLQRYEFINRFSSIARSYGYNIRVFDNQAKFVGAYTCDFSGLDIRQTQTTQPQPELPSSFHSTTLPMQFHSRNQMADTLNCKMVIDATLKTSSQKVLK
jgi:hypothetical protein